MLPLESNRKIFFYSSRLFVSTSYFLYVFSFPVGFLYNERTGITSQIRHNPYFKEKIELKEGFTRIDNIIEAISDIYTTENNENEIVRTNKKFFVTKYFEECLKEVLESSGVPKEKLDIVFVLKDEWCVDSEKCPYSLGPGIVDNLLKPLLQNAILPRQNDSVKVLFMSQLEAWISYSQFRVLLPSLVTRRLKSDSELLKLIQNERRCLMYTLIRDKGTIELRLTYFQLVEDYNLRLFDQKYYTPKIECMKSNSNFNAIDFKDAIEELVISQQLKADHLFDTPPGDNIQNYNRKKTTDMIIDIVFENIIVICHSSSNEI